MADSSTATTNQQTSSAPKSLTKTCPAEILALYAFTLMITGALAYYASGLKKGALSSVYVGNGGAVVSLLLAFGVRDMTLKKGDAGYIAMMICIHIAMVFPLVMATAVGWRLALAWNVAEKQYLRPYLCTIVGASLLTVAMLYTFKPRREKKDHEKNAAGDDAASHASDARQMEEDAASSLVGGEADGRDDGEAPAEGGDGAVVDASGAAVGRRAVGRGATGGKVTTGQSVVRKRARRATAI